MSSGGEFGPAGPAPGGLPPFAVAGPSTVSLDAARSVAASFTVSNVTGRPVRARVIVLPGAGAEASWFQVAGESERALPVAGTATVEVAVKVAPDAPAGSYSFALGAALEEAPDQVVSGPTVAFQVPEPKEKKFPWWIVIVVAAAVLLLVGGGLAIWFLTRPPSPPKLTEPPTISGSVEVGSELAVEPGVWDPDDAMRIHVWQACPGTASDADDGGCEDILVETGSDVESARGPTYVVGADVVGMRIRVIETAVIVDPEAFGEDGPDDLSDLPHESAASGMTDAVPAAPPTTALVPDVVGLSLGDAQSVLSQAGFQILGTTSSETGECNPKVEDQNPDPDQEATIGSVVGVTTKQPPPIWTCLKIDLDDDVVIWDDRFFEGVVPSD